MTARITRGCGCGICNPAEYESYDEYADQGQTELIRSVRNHIDQATGLDVRGTTAAIVPPPMFDRVVVDELATLDATAYSTLAAAAIRSARFDVETSFGAVASQWTPVYFTSNTVTTAPEPQWMDWHGGECPVDQGVEVEVELRYGLKTTRMGTAFFWQHEFGDDDIVRYRILTPGATPKASAPRPTWIDWTGGNRRLLPDTVVRVRFRAGYELQGEADDFRWRHSGTGDDIVAYYVVKPGVPKPLTPLQGPTEREVRIAKLMARGITPIPDDECTDKGDYVIWNKYDPTCTLLTGSHASLTGMTTIDQYRDARYTENEIDYEVRSKNYRAHPDKPVRIVGWFRLDSTHAYFRATSDNEQLYALYDSYMRIRSSREIAKGLVPLVYADLPVAVRHRRMRHLLDNCGNRGTLHMLSSHMDLIDELERGSSQNYYAAFRRTSMYMPSIPEVRQQLRKIGQMVNKYEDHDASDMVDAINALPEVIREQVQRNIVDAWNVRASDELEIAGCGHVCEAGESHDLRDGRETVCSDCFEDCCYVEDRDYYDWRDNAYRHDDDCWYSYSEGDDDDDSDDDDDESAGGLVRNYSTDVRGYFKADPKIVPSQYGEFLMGIELEVEPKHSRRAAAQHTYDTLCPDYAILKNDGSLDEDGFEIVTAPRSLKEHIERFTKWKPHELLRSWDSGNCGTHVHISSQAFSQATLGKFIEFINAEENDKFIRSIAGRGPGGYCHREGQVITGNPKKTLAGKSGDRYRMVNVQNLSGREAERLGMPYVDRNGKGLNTIELRIFRGTLKKSRFLAQIEFAHAAVMFCRWTSMRELRQEHFLAWLKKSAGMYPHLAKWFGVKANTDVVNAAPAVQAEAEV